MHPTTGYTESGQGEGMGQKISRKAGEVWEGVKEATPGTAEHAATKPTTGMTGGMGTTGMSTSGVGTGMDAGMAPGMGTSTVTHSTAGGTGMHRGTGMHGGVATHTGVGQGEPVGDKVARKAGEVWEGVKEATPGTAEHKATHPHPGFTSSAATTEELHHSQARNANV